MTTASRVFIPEGTQPKEGSLAHSSQRLWLKTSTLPLVTEKGSGRHLVISITGKLLSLSERNLIPVICVWELKGYQSKPNWFGKVRYLVKDKQVGYFSKTRHTKHIYRLFSFLLDLITDLVDSWNAVGSKPSNYNQKHSLLDAKAATLRLAVRLLYLGDSRWVVGGAAPGHQLGQVEGSSREGARGKPMPSGETVYLPHTESNEEGVFLQVQWLRLRFPMGASSILARGARHAFWPKIQNIKQMQYCNKFNKGFKNGPYQKQTNKMFKKKKRIQRGVHGAEWGDEEDGESLVDWMPLCYRNPQGFP